MTICVSSLLLYSIRTFGVPTQVNNYIIRVEKQITRKTRAQRSDIIVITYTYSFNVKTMYWCDPMSKTRTSDVFCTGTGIRLIIQNKKHNINVIIQLLSTIVSQ